MMVTNPDGSAIAMRLTDRSGRIEPIPISVPDLAASQTPDTGIIPFTNVNIYARLENYEQIEAENVQIFADTVTDQNLEMIPLSELPDKWTKAEIFRTPAQNL
ncbi:MAG: spore cortex-lytic protein [Oscillospiraceae bacterium]|nr:spore cortex-lytic protein [Oscillospiraceae bacterium]